MYTGPVGITSLLHLLFGHPIATICCLVFAGSLYLGLNQNTPPLVCCSVLESTPRLWTCAETADPATLALVKDVACGDWPELFGP